MHKIKFEIKIFLVFSLRGIYCEQWGEFVFRACVRRVLTRRVMSWDIFSMSSLISCLFPVDRIRTMDRKDTNTPCERVAYTGMLKAQTNISAQTAKDIELLRQLVEFRPAPIQETQTTPDGHIVIDPAVRERIANPKCPVRMPEKPFESLSFHDFTRRDNCSKRRNKSLVNGLFGRKWREKLEKQQEREYAEEEKNSEESSLDIRDNICPTFMIWGVCHRGDRCQLRHPSYRYLERPKKASPEPADEEPKPRDPNSYAAILEKTRSPEPEEFVNDGLPMDCLTEDALEEAWPTLGSPEQGRISKAPKAWRPKRDTPNGPQVWVTKSTTQKGPWILEERPKATVEQLQIANDELIADNLQANEYATLNVNDENNEGYYSYYNPEQEVNEDEFLEHVEETNAENEDSFAHHEGKVVNVERFNSSSSSPVILEKNSGSVEDPDPPKFSSTCDICMDRPKDATLVCGHRYCYQCALQMRLDERVCAICRRCIVSVIKTYN